MPEIILQLKGANAAEVAGILAGRLAEFGCAAAVMEGGLRIETQKEGRPPQLPGSVPTGLTLAVELDAHDTADFAAEKVVDILAENGVISMPSAGYSREEEETIRRRLQDLGYIE